jgi:hypothetical protein
MDGHRRAASAVRAQNSAYRPRSLTQITSIRVLCADTLRSQGSMFRGVGVFDYQTIKLLHRHGNDDYAPMTEASEHNSASHDPERSWLRSARIFRCDRCDDEVVITPAAEPKGEEPGQSA